MNISFTDHLTAEDYTMLRRSAEWPVPHPQQVAQALKNSALIVVAKDGEATVGMARLVSDSGYVFLIVDVVVLPAYQRNGIGRAMMDRVMKYILGTLQQDYCIQIDLMSAPGKEDFYRSFGFVERSCEGYGSGMSLRITGQCNSTPSDTGEQT